jgi:hypothetical protein
MADPIVVACAADAWTKVLTNVTTATIFEKETDIDYMWTFVDTGNPAPTTFAKALPFPKTGMRISNSTGIDVYIWCPAGDAGNIWVTP